MKLNKTTLLLMILSISTLFTECKKGEDDPFLSLRTRKARLAGEWTLASGYDKHTYTNYLGNIIHNDVTYNGTTSTQTITGYQDTTYIQPHKLRITFERDGTVIHTTTGNGTGTLVGTWNFTAGIGEYKNKEQIVLHFTSMVNSNKSATMSGDHTDVTYTIKELRNKRLVLTSKQEYKSGSYFDTAETEYILEQ